MNKIRLSAILFFIFGLLSTLSGFFSFSTRVYFSLFILVAFLIINIKKKYKIIFPGFLLLIIFHTSINLYYLLLSSSGIFSYISELSECISFLLICLPIFTTLRNKQFFLYGILSSILFFSLVSLLNYFNLINSNLLPYHQYWENLGRSSLTFSDPNEYGVFTAIILSFLIYIFCSTKLKLSKYSQLIIIVLLFITASFSGSRTLYLGTIISVLIYFFSKKNFLKFLIPLLFILTLVFSVSNTDLCKNTPNNIKRICNSFDYNNLKTTLYSRTVFTRLNLEIFKDNKLVGVGNNNFEDVLPEYKDQLGLKLNNWIDNPNSFYLGILSELGILGFLVFLLDLFFIRYLSKSNIFNSACKNSILTFSILLFTGPHLNYLSVAILLNYLFSNLEFESKLNSKYLILNSILLTIIFSLTLIKTKEREYGLFPYETNDIGKFQWTSGKFRKRFNCENNVISFRIRAVHPDIISNPITISLDNEEEIIRKIINSFNNEIINFKCKSNSTISGTVSRVWAPEDMLESTDARKLGIQIYEK